MTLSSTIDSYLHGGHRGTNFSLGDLFSIIHNPTFSILPNHPYRSPLVVATYCRQGHGTGRVNARTFQIAPGGFFIVLPGQITELVDISTDFEATYVILSEEFIAGLTIGNSLNLQQIVAERPYTLLEDQARHALEEYISMCSRTISTESNPYRYEILRHLTLAFFPGLGYFLHRDSRAETTDRGSRLTERFLRLVEENYREQRSLQFYAEKLGLTPKYISSTIKASSGKSAMEWIEHYVTLDAIAQLTSTNRSVKAISYDLNFPSPSFFGKYFARIVGISPAQYRERYRSSAH